jgi:hypothetical protein
MNKSTTYVGQHILSQIFSLCPKNELAHLFIQAKFDYRAKRLRTWEHFVTMMFSVLSGGTSLRETCMGLEAYEVSSITSTSKKFHPEARCPMPTSGVHLLFFRKFLITSITSTKVLSRTALCQMRCCPNYF